jgi:hypothetical protein
MSGSLDVAAEIANGRMVARTTKEDFILKKALRSY